MRGIAGGMDRGMAFSVEHVEQLAPQFALRNHQQDFGLERLVGHSSQRPSRKRGRCVAGACELRRTATSSILATSAGSASNSTTRRTWPAGARANWRNKALSIAD